MSHYLTTVIVPANVVELGDEAISNYLNVILAPFDENLSVEPYIDKCYCVGRKAKREVEDLAIEKFGSWDKRRIDFSQMKSFDGRTNEEVRTECVSVLYSGKEYTDKEIERAEKLESQLDKDWQAYLSPIQQFEDELFKNHPDKDKADSTCGFYSGERADWWPATAKEGDRYNDESGCAGTGSVTSTSNPNAKWDWWCIGGRWNGWLAPADKKPENNPDNWEKCFVCHGTGMRNDPLGLEARQNNPEYTCNGCSGKGQTLKFPSSQIDSGFNIVSVNYIESLALFGKLPVPRAFVDLEGKWNSRGDMGWFGISNNDKDVEVWEETWKQALLDAPDDAHIVVVDMHI